MFPGVQMRPDGTKPLHEPMLTWDYWQSPSVVSQKMYKNEIFKGFYVFFSICFLFFITRTTYFEMT